MKDDKLTKFREEKVKFTTPRFAHKMGVEGGGVLLQHNQCVEQQAKQNMGKTTNGVEQQGPQKGTLRCGSKVIQQGEAKGEASRHGNKAK